MSMPAVAGTPVKASLSETATGKQVLFQFNPQKISVSHGGGSADDITSPTQSTDKEHQPNNTGTNDATAKATFAKKISKIRAMTVSMSDVLFDGPGTKTACAQLLDWSIPSIPTSGAQNPVMPQLLFTWGTLTYSVNLTTVEVSYERFTSTGTPVRAKVRLQCQTIPAPAGPTNPTSGGIPGRRSHTVVAGENLQHIATANYGRPGAWRALAAANGIEDPLGVQPGTVIYLPAQAELGDRSAR